METTPDGWSVNGLLSNHYNRAPFRDESDLYLSYWGKENCSPGHAVGPGIRDFYKIHFIHKGQGQVKVRGQTFVLTAGQAFIIYPKVVTSYEADQENPWTYSWIAFYGAWVPNILAKTHLTPDSPVFPMDKKVMPGLYESLSITLNEFPNPELRIMSIMYGFMSLLTEICPISLESGSLHKKQDSYIHQSLEFVHSHYAESISVQQLAGHLGLDRKYLSSLFKESVGVSPQQYLLRYRMEKACELLISGRYLVGEVARSVGYQDALVFSKMFKKEKGYSPKQWIESFHNRDIRT
ncbi:AraC family transcriptional regulator [Paenibacillus albus]|uniref:AraC family transcriptional regulator n=1 Tax=Paenibacillus albus TaxID=2495582 RepID=A0A3Q8X631_9BACL|nr:AraC family transcriptional regulator [Paenibacillus albus]AZN41354.1 AraC family transcriptional regulator [Paenibacillus albus]